MLLKYPGGKTKTRKKIMDFFPPEFNEFRDCFCGNSPFLWNLPTSMPRWINDKDEDVYRYYLALQNDPTFVQKFLDLKNSCLSVQQIIDQHEIQKHRLLYYNCPVAYLFLRRTSLKQIVNRLRPNICSLSYDYLKDGLIPIKRWKIEQARDIMQGVKVTNTDYTVLLNAPGAKPLIFLDPPYRMNRSPMYGYNFQDEDFIRLRDNLRNCPYNWMLTINDEPMMRDLFREWEYDTFYYRSSISNKQKEAVELWVRNY